MASGAEAKAVAAPSALETWRQCTVKPTHRLDMGKQTSLLASLVPHSMASNMSDEVSDDVSAPVGKRKRGQVVLTDSDDDTM